MNKNETKAVLHYLEFHLLSFVEGFEKHITDPDVIGSMYDRAYSIVHDLENTLDTQQQLDGKAAKHTS